MLPLGEATGGHGLPLGAMPGVVELPWVLPDVEEPELEDPVFGFVLFGLEGVPGKVPQGEVGVVPGVVLGSIVEG